MFSFQAWCSFDFLKWKTDSSSISIHMQYEYGFLFMNFSHLFSDLDF